MADVGHVDIVKRAVAVFCNFMRFALVGCIDGSLSVNREGIKAASGTIIEKDVSPIISVILVPNETILWEYSLARFGKLVSNVPTKDGNHGAVSANSVS